MIEIVTNEWRPFIKLHTTLTNKDTNETYVSEVYFDVTKRPTLYSLPNGGTSIILANEDEIAVNETPLEILEAVDKMIKAEQEKKAQEAAEYMKATAERVAATAAKLEGE